MTPLASLKLQRTIPGPRDAVFEAWLTPDALRHFMIPGPSVTVVEVAVNPIVGGRFRIVLRDGQRDLAHEGEYVEIERPRRLVFTWSSPLATDTLVTIELEALDDRTTKLTLTHERFAAEDVRDRHASGWTSVLQALAVEMEGR